MGKIANFFKEVWGELQKVVWPSRRQTIVYTSQVILLSLAVAMILGAADYGLLKLVAKVLKQ